MNKIKFNLIIVMILLVLFSFNIPGVSGDSGFEFTPNYIDQLSIRSGEKYFTLNDGMNFSENITVSCTGGVLNCEISDDRTKIIVNASIESDEIGYVKVSNSTDVVNTLQVRVVPSGSYKCTGVVIESDKVVLIKGDDESQRSVTFTAKAVPAGCDENDLEYRWDHSFEGLGWGVAEDSSEYDETGLGYEGYKKLKITKGNLLSWGEEEYTYWVNVKYKGESISHKSNEIIIQIVPDIVDFVDISGPDEVRDGQDLTDLWTSNIKVDWFGDMDWTASGSEYESLDSNSLKCCNGIKTPDSSAYMFGGESFYLKAERNGKQVWKKKIKVPRIEEKKLTLVVKEEFGGNKLEGINLKVVELESEVNREYTGTTNSQGKVSFDVPVYRLLELELNGDKVQVDGGDNFQITDKITKTIYHNSEGLEGYRCEGVRIVENGPLFIAEGEEIKLNAEVYPAGCNDTGYEYQWKLDGKIKQQDSGVYLDISKTIKSKTVTNERYYMGEYTYTAQGRYGVADWKSSEPILVIVGVAERDLGDYWIDGPSWIYEGGKFSDDKWSIRNSSHENVGANSWDIDGNSIYNNTFKSACCKGESIPSKDFTLSAQLGEAKFEKKIEVKKRDTAKLKLIVQDAVTYKLLKDVEVFISYDGGATSKKTTNRKGEVKIKVPVGEYLQINLDGVDTGEKFEIAGKETRSVLYHKVDREAYYLKVSAIPSIIELDEYGNGSFNLKLEIVDKDGNSKAVGKILTGSWESNKKIFPSLSNPSVLLDSHIISANDIAGKNDASFNYEVDTSFKFNSIKDVKVWFDVSSLTAVESSYPGDLQIKSEELTLTFVPSDKTYTPPLEVEIMGDSVIRVGKTVNYTFNTESDVSDCSFSWTFKGMEGSDGTFSIIPSSAFEDEELLLEVGCTDSTKDISVSKKITALGSEDIGISVNLNKEGDKYVAEPGKEITVSSQSGEVLKWTIGGGDVQGSKGISKTFNAPNYETELTVEAESLDGRKDEEIVIKIIDPCSARSKIGVITGTIKPSGGALEFSSSLGGTAKYTPGDNNGSYTITDVPLCINIDITFKQGGVSKTQTVSLDSDHTSREKDFDFGDVSTECTSQGISKTINNKKVQWEKGLALCGDECIQGSGDKWCCDGSFLDGDCAERVIVTISGKSALKVGETGVKYTASAQACDGEGYSFNLDGPDNNVVLTQNGKEVSFNSPSIAGIYVLEANVTCNGDSKEGRGHKSITVGGSGVVSLTAPNNVHPQQKFNVTTLNGVTVDWKYELPGSTAVEEDTFITITAGNSGKIKVTATSKDGKEKDTVTIEIVEGCIDRTAIGKIEGIIISSENVEFSSESIDESVQYTFNLSGNNNYQIKDVPLCTEVDLKFVSGGITRTEDVYLTLDKTTETVNFDFGDVSRDCIEKGVQPIVNNELSYTSEELVLCGDTCYKQGDAALSGKNYCCGGVLSSTPCTVDDWCSVVPPGEVTEKSCKCGDKNNNQIEFCEKSKYCYSKKIGDTAQCYGDAPVACSGVFKGGNTNKDKISVTETCQCENGDYCTENQLCDAGKCYDYDSLSNCNTQIPGKVEEVCKCKDETDGNSKDVCVKDKYCYDKGSGDGDDCYDKFPVCDVTEFGAGTPIKSGTTATALPEPCSCNGEPCKHSLEIDTYCYTKLTGDVKCLTAQQKTQIEEYLNTDCDPSDGTRQVTSAPCVCNKELEIYNKCEDGEFCRSEGTCEEKGDKCVNGVKRCANNVLYDCSGIVSGLTRWEMIKNCSITENGKEGYCHLVGEYKGECVYDEKKLCEGEKGLIIKVTPKEDIVGAILKVERVDSACGDKLNGKLGTRTLSEGSSSASYSKLPYGEYKITVKKDGYGETVKSVWLVDVTTEDIMEVYIELVKGEGELKVGTTKVTAFNSRAGDELKTAFENYLFNGGCEKNNWKNTVCCKDGAVITTTVRTEGITGLKTKSEFDELGNIKIVLTFNCVKEGETTSFSLEPEVHSEADKNELWGELMK